MDKLFGKGYLGQTSAVVIAIVIVLKVMLPYVVGADSDSAPLTKLEVVEAIEPLKTTLRDLQSLNENQADADSDNSKAHQELTIALIKLSGALERVAIAVERLDK